MAQIAALKMEDIVQLVPQNLATQNTTLDQSNQVVVELKHPAKVFHIFRKEAYRLSSLAPAHFKKMELLSGRWDEEGSVRKCTYVVQGKTETLVDEVIKADDCGIMVYKVLDGNITNHYKNVYAILRTIEVNAFNGLAQWVLVYEKNNPKCPCPVDPKSYLNVLKAVTQDVDNKVDAN